MIGHNSTKSSLENLIELWCDDTDRCIGVCSKRFTTENRLNPFEGAEKWRNWGGETELGWCQWAFPYAEIVKNYLNLFFLFLVGLLAYTLEYEYIVGYITWHQINYPPPLITIEACSETGIATLSAQYSRVLTYRRPTEAIEVRLLDYHWAIWHQDDMHRGLEVSLSILDSTLRQWCEI